MDKKVWILIVVFALIFLLSSGPRAAITGYHALQGETEESRHFDQHTKSDAHHPEHDYGGNPIVCTIYDIIVPHKQETHENNK